MHVRYSTFDLTGEVNVAKLDVRGHVNSWRVFSFFEYKAIQFQVNIAFLCKFLQR